MSPIVWIRGLECTRCGHQWLPRTGVDLGKLPAVCANCKSKYWDTPIEREDVSRANSKGSPKWQRQFGNQD
jgi:hypothetical protein